MRIRVEVVVLSDDLSSVGVLRFPDGGHALPGGGVDPGQSHEEAARMEVLEEMGYRIDKVRMLEIKAKIGIVSTIQALRKSRVQEETHTTWAYAVLDYIKTKRTEAEAEVVWVPLNKLEEVKLSPDAIHAVDQALIAQTRRPL